MLVGLEKKVLKIFLNLNDIIYVKKIKKNKWNLKQLPKLMELL